MGHREDLLAGAKQCLLDLGYARTTARDIVAISGTNLASIGYHFGSKDALLRQAIIDLTGEWGDELSRIVAEQPVERMWTRIGESFARHRKLWLVQLEALVQAERSPELRTAFADGQEEARLELAGMFHRFAADVDARTRRAVGSLYLALISGMAVQWLVDPDRALTGPEVVQAFTTVAEALAPS